MHHNPVLIAQSAGRKDVGVMLRYVKPNRRAVYDALRSRRPLREGAE